MTPLEGFAHFLGIVLRRQPTPEELRAQREQAERELEALHLQWKTPAPTAYDDLEWPDEPTIEIPAIEEK